jgi:hypothetical protein
VLDAVDTELAEVVTDWGPLASAKLVSAADAVIDRHDPAAVLAHRSAVRSRDVQFGNQDDATGTTSLWGRLLATDGELLRSVRVGVQRTDVICCLPFAPVSALSVTPFGACNALHTQHLL